MAPTTNLQHLTNPLITSTQLIQFQNQSSSETQSIHFAQSLLTQSAGILLRLPQEVIATALVLLQRYRVISDTKHSNHHTVRTISSAAIYLAAKLSFTPLSPRSIINVYAYLKSQSPHPPWIAEQQDQNSNTTNKNPPTSYHVTEGTYHHEKQLLFSAEFTILSTLAFNTHVSLPYTLALTYLSALGVSTSKELSMRVFEHLNGALLSPQMLYLTHQPNSLAVAAIYLGAREVGVKLVEENWWEVFDVDREDLGFLVLALGSLEGFAEAEGRRWRDMGGVLLDA